jgi:hypothetical protein
MDNLFVGSTQDYARTVIFWNLALHSDGKRVNSTGLKSMLRALRLAKAPRGG